MNADPVACIRHLPVREQIKYCAARYAWQHRYELCKREFNGVKVTWAKWFEFVFKQPLVEYVEWCRKQKFYQHNKGST